jgi:hypothetical protein
MPETLFWTTENHLILSLPRPKTVITSTRAHMFNLGIPNNKRYNYSPKGTIYPPRVHPSTVFQKKPSTGWGVILSKEIMFSVEGKPSDE